MENVAGRVCRESGSRVTTQHHQVRDMDLSRPDVHDTRQLEVVVDGLSIFECPVGCGHHVVSHVWLGHPQLSP